MNKKLEKKLTDIIEYLKEHHFTITTMESCTSGSLASYFTNIDGASEVLKGAFITYSNETKIQQGVSSAIIDKYGVYSKETALEMALACQKQYKTTIGIGITGTIGKKDPNNKDSIKNTCYYCIISSNGTIIEEKIKLKKQKNKQKAKEKICKHIINRLYELFDI